MCTLKEHYHMFTTLFLFLTICVCVNLAPSYSVFVGNENMGHNLLLESKKIIFIGEKPKFDQ